MRLKKNVPPFIFTKMTKQQMVQYLNAKYPIGISKLEDLVDRVHARYPFIDKSSVALIIKSIFSLMREYLVLGKVLSVNGLFVNAYLKFYNKPRHHGIRNIRVKTAIQTPPEMRTNGF